MTGRMVGAAEACAIGMVDRVVPGENLIAEAETLARTIAAHSPLAIASIKRALNATERNDLRAQLELESEHQVRCFESDEAKERIAAFGVRQR